MPSKILQEAEALKILGKTAENTVASISKINAKIKELEHVGLNVKTMGFDDSKIKETIAQLQILKKELQDLKRIQARGLKGSDEFGNFSVEKNKALSDDSIRKSTEYSRIQRDINALLRERRALYASEAQYLDKLSKRGPARAVYAQAAGLDIDRDTAVLMAKKAAGAAYQMGGVGGGAVKLKQSGVSDEGKPIYQMSMAIKDANDRLTTLKINFDNLGNAIGKGTVPAKLLNDSFGYGQQKLSETGTEAMKLVDSLQKLWSINYQNEKVLEAQNVQYQKMLFYEDRLKKLRGDFDENGVPLGNGPMGAPVVDVRKDLEDTLKDPNLYAKDFGQKEKLNQNLIQLQETDNRLAKQKIDLLDKQKLKIYELLQATKQMMFGTAGAGGAGGGWNIPHPPGSPPGMPPGGDIPPEPPAPPDPVGWTKTKPLFSDQQLQKLGAEYQAAFEYAAGLGFKNTDLKKVFRQVGGTPNTGFQFTQRDEATGAIKSLSVTMDQFGRVVPEVSRRFRNFTQGVVRDLRELAKWTIAIGLIYGPMNALSNLMSTMVENESKLADATIAVNNVMIDQGTIFNVVADSAQMAGENITGVIDAFVLAYRATGGMADESERLTTAQKLLNDSLILSKLSGMGQAEAIDTLAAGLRQVGGSLEGTGDALTKGTILLDKWVRVTQVANVDLMTLATGFSILGETADSAGIDIDKLNATIAVIAEATPYSGREAANAVRFMIGGYQSQQAVTELNKYGISVLDTTGKVRGFLEVMGELAEMKRLGIIDKEAFNSIANAIGGGSRGASRVQAFIENFGRIDQISKESFGASGQAGDAMAKKLDTVQTAVTRFTNAMQGLAQALGNQGGLLDIFKGVVDFGTQLVTVLDQIIQLTGKATPVLMGLGIAAVMFGKNTPEVRSNMLQSFSLGLANKFVPVSGGVTRPAGLVPPGAEQLAWDNRQRLANKFTGFAGSKAFGIGAGLATAAIPAAMNLSQGNTPAAVADLVGGLIGASIATLAGSPLLAPVGAAVGASIAEAFVAATMGYKAEFQAFFGGQGEISYGEPPGSTSGKTPEELEAEIFAAVGGKLRAATLRSSEYDQQNQAIRNLIDKQGYNVKGGYFAESTIKSGGRGGGGTFELTGPRGQTVTYTKPTASEYSYAAAMEELKRINPQLAAEIEAVEAKRVAEEGTAGPAYLRQQQVLQQTGVSSTALAQKQRDELMNQMIQGEITTGEFGKRTAPLKGAPEQVSRWLSTFGDEYIKLSTDIDNASEAQQAFIEIISAGSDEGISYLNSLTTASNSLENQLAAFSGEEVDIKITLNGEDITFDKRTAAELALSNINEELAAIADTTVKEIQFNKIKIPNVVGSLSQPTAQGDYNKIMEEAYKMQGNFADNMGWSSGEVEEWTSRMEDFVVLTEDAGKIQYSTAKKLEERWYNAAQEKLLEEGAITKQSKGMGFATYDVTRSQLEAAASQSIAMANQWKTQFGYQPDIEQQIAITKDAVTQPITADLQIMQMLLQRIVDINQKQLDGMYNLPEGATFWVPITAAYYRHQGGGGGGVTTPEGSGTGAETTTTTAPTGLVTKPEWEKKAEDYMNQYDKDWKPITAKNYDADKFKTPGLSARLDQEARSEDAQQRDAAKDSTLQQILSSIQAFLAGISGTSSSRGGTFKEAPNSSDVLGAGAGGIGGGARPSTRGAIPQTAVNTAPSAKVNLNFRNTTTLLVDGRVLATVIKQYLASDLLKTSSAYGSSTKNYIV